MEAQAYGGYWKRTAKLVPKNGSVTPVVKPKVSTDYRLESGGFRSGLLSSTLRLKSARLRAPFTCSSS